MTPTAAPTQTVMIQDVLHDRDLCVFGVLFSQVSAEFILEYVKRDFVRAKLAINKPAPPKKYPKCAILSTKGIVGPSGIVLDVDESSHRTINHPTQAMR